MIDGEKKSVFYYTGENLLHARMKYVFVGDQA